jgi:CHRD domain
MLQFRRGLVALLVVLAVAAIGVASATAGGVTAAPVQLKAKLIGANEVPGPGDPDGRGTANLTIDGATGVVCYKIYAQRLTLPSINGHIHEGPKGVSGPVVVQLAGPDASKYARGCMSTSPTQAADILANPAGFYVNVHTTDFPGGAIRGQLKLVP